MDTTNIFNSIFNLINFLLAHDYSSIVYVLKILAVFLSAGFIYAIIYSSRQSGKIFKIMHAFARPAHVPEDKHKNIEEWQKILKEGQSPNESERKFAVIAADTLIEKILSMAGYSGENLGEKLKGIEKGDLNSLNDLWEAHKARNRIAHEAGFKLSQEETSRALSLFEKALKELEYI